MDIRRKQPMGVELVKRGIVKESDIENALDYQRKNPDMKLGDILYELDVCDPNVLISAMGDVLGTKGILLTNSIIKININEYLSTDIARKNQAVPFDIENGKIKLETWHPMMFRYRLQKRKCFWSLLYTLIIKNDNDYYY